MRISAVSVILSLAAAGFSYDLTPVSYKPIPGSSANDDAGSSANANTNATDTATARPNINLRSMSRAIREARRPVGMRRRGSASASSSSVDSADSTSPLADYALQSITYKPIPGTQALAAADSAEPDTPASVAGTDDVAAQDVLSGAPNVQQNNAKKKNATSTSSSTSTSSAAKHAHSSAAALSASSENDKACDVDAYDPPAVDHQEFPPYDQTTANVYRYRQQRSVNLGSWFVHESWMTPSVFACAAEPKAAEYDIANGWGTQTHARAVLERHWDTFIQAADFDYLADVGINTVRLPIGYWSLGPDFMAGTPFEPVAPVYANAWARVVRAVNLAGARGIGVLIDLHGAVGSQNGQPHSGVSDGRTGLFDSEVYAQKTIAVLTFLAQTFGSVNNIVGIQILNEPQFADGLLDFYSRAVEAMRNVSPTARTMPLYLHDGFDLAKFASYVGQRTDFVVQDHHSYFVFSPGDQDESGEQHAVDVEGAIAKELLIAANATHRNFVVDEWSCALTPQSLEKDNDASKVRKDFCTDQLEVYTNTTAGWGFWSYMKEDCYTDPGWCFKAAVGNSLPSTFFPTGKAASMEDVSALAKNVSDTLIIPTVTAEILNLIQTKMQSIPETGSTPLSRRTFPYYRQRFDVIHQRRDEATNGDASSSYGNSTSTTGNNGTSSDAMKSSTSKGYTDGFTTAKVFASYNMSQLGFIDQFMSDAIRVAGPTLIVTGTEYGYQGGFMQGLKDGEALAAGSQ